jgi:hypothetical protein
MTEKGLLTSRRKSPYAIKALPGEVDDLGYLEPRCGRRTVLRLPSIATDSTVIATSFPNSGFYNFDMGCTSQTNFK